MPTLVTLGTTCSITSSTGLGSSPICTISGSTYVITTPFTNGGISGTADYIGGTLISITISFGYNAISARDAGAWSVSTFNYISSSYYGVDSGSATSSFTSV